MSNQFKPMGLELQEGWVYEPEFDKPFQNPQTGQNLSREEYEQFILHPNDVKWEGKWLSDETIQFLKGQINSGKSLYKLNFTTPGQSDAWHVDDIAKRLTALGITDLAQIGVDQTKGIYNKVTGEPLNTAMVGGKGGNIIGSTGAGKGYSNYTVQTDAFGSPIIIPEWDTANFAAKNPLLVQALSFAASFAIPGIGQAIAPYISGVVGAAAAPAVSQFLVRTAVNTVFNGGDLGKAFVSAATGEILQGVTQAIGGAMVDSGIVNSMQTATAIASPMVSALNAVLRGEDPMKALVNGAVNSAVSSAISNYATSQKLDPTSRTMLQIGAAEAINYFRTGKFDPNALAMKFVGMGIGQAISQAMASAEAKDRIANMSVDAIRSIKADPVAMEAIRAITDNPDEILHAGKSQSEIDQIDLGEFNNGNLRATDEDVKQIWKSEFGEDPTNEQSAPLLGADRDTLIKTVNTTRENQIQEVKNSPEFPKKWDVADAVWTPEQAMEYLQSNKSEIPMVSEYPPNEVPEVVKITPEIQELSKIIPPEYKPEVPLETQSENIPKNPYFKCLGHENNGGTIYVFFNYRTNSVIRFTASSFSSSSILQLAPLNYWEGNYSKDSRSGGVKFDLSRITDTLISICSRLGIFDSNMIRGRGAVNKKFFGRF